MEATRSLATTLAGKFMPTCVYNAAGVRCTSHDELTYLESLPVGAVLTKSCTRYANIGNPSPTYWSNDLFSINANGLTNHGIQYYIDYDLAINDPRAKPYIISTIDTTCIALIEEYLACDLIEYNNSCPNVKEESIEESAVRLAIECTAIPVGIKSRPMFRPDDFATFAEYVDRVGLKYVTAINSVPNCLYLDNDYHTPVVSAGFGGMGGKAILPIALSNVAYHKHYLSSKVDVVACGGVTTADDVQTYRTVGAAAVQIGTAFQNDPDIFTKLI